MKESTFTNKIEKWLQSQGIYKANTPKQDKDKPTIGWYFKHWGGGMATSGIPDLICCINGKFVGLELKATNGRPSVLQVMNIQSIIESNGLGVIVYPDDFETLTSEIRRLV